MTGTRPTHALGTTAFAVTCAVLAGIADPEEGSLAILAGGMPAGYLSFGGAWRTAVVMATAYGLGRVTRFWAWVWFDGSVPRPGPVGLALLACALAPAAGALLRRLSEQLQRVG